MTTPNTHLAIATWNAMIAAQTALANGGTVVLYDGLQPATPDVAVTTQNALLTLTLANPSFAAPSGGSAVSDGTPNGFPSMNGTAAWFRVYALGGAACWDGDVGAIASGADMTISPSVNLVTTSHYTIGGSQWTVSMPVGQ